MTRRCKHCNSNGHTARACSNKGGGGGGGGVRLFGVRLTDGSFYKKSASMGNIAQCSAAADSPDGYHSDDPDRDSGGHRPRIRKKGVPWTEEEHKQFLIGLQEKGKGHWLAISKSFVPSRKPSQVASHAQKYFIRQNTATTKRKRASLFDMAPDMEITAPAPPPVGADINEAPLVLSSPSREVVDMESSMPSLELSLKPAFTPLPFQLWPPNAYALKDDEEAETSHGHIPVVPEAPMKEVVGMAKLTLGETVAMEVESSLSLSKG